MKYQNILYLIPLLLSPTLSRAEKNASDVAPLPEAITSFGAAVLGDRVYVYSGHIGEAHAHSKANLSRRFSRVNLRSGDAWETLPMQTPLQGLALVAVGERVVRIGGMQPQNGPGEDEDLRSVAEVAAFDPRTRQWSPLPELPEPRSSHDAAVVGSTIYVVGGWQLNHGSKWHSTAWKLDTAASNPAWKPLPEPPFHRRALTLVAWGDKLWAIGGMTEKGPSGEVHELDLATSQWSAKPTLPGKPIEGFGCAAAVDQSQLIVSTMSGQLLRIGPTDSTWSTAGQLTLGRFFHRLVPTENGLLSIGGASSRGHLTTVEYVKWNRNTP